MNQWRLASLFGTELSPGALVRHEFDADLRIFSSLAVFGASPRDGDIGNVLFNRTNVALFGATQFSEPNSLVGIETSTPPGFCTTATRAIGLIGTSERIRPASANFNNTETPHRSGHNPVNDTETKERTFDTTSTPRTPGKNPPTVQYTIGRFSPPHIEHALICTFEAYTCSTTLRASVCVERTRESYGRAAGIT